MENATMCLTHSTLGGSLIFRSSASRISVSTILVSNTTLRMAVQNEVGVPLKNTQFLLWDSIEVKSVNLQLEAQSAAVFGDDVVADDVTIAAVGSTDPVKSSVYVSNNATLGANGGTVNTNTVPVVKGNSHLEPFRSLLNQTCTSLELETPHTHSVTLTHQQLSTLTPTNTRSATQQSTKSSSLVVLTKTPTTPQQPTTSVTLQVPPNISATVVPKTVSPSLVPLTTEPIHWPTPEPVGNATDPPPPSVPTPSPPDTIADAAKGSLTISIVLGSEDDAEAVAASTATSVALSSAFTPTAASQLSRVVSATRAVSCVMSDGDERPSMYELPIQFPVGNGNLRFYAGGALGSSLICAVLFLTVVLLRHVAQQPTTFPTVTSRSMISDL